MDETRGETIHESPKENRSGRIIVAALCGLAAFFMGGEMGHRRAIHSLFGGWIILGTCLVGAAVAIFVYLKGSQFLRRRPIGSGDFSRLLLWFGAYVLGSCVSPMLLSMGVARYTVEPNMGYLKLNELLSTEFAPKYHTSSGFDVRVSVRRGDAEDLEAFLKKADIVFRKRQ